jgi:hypothetical protein
LETLILSCLTTTTITGYSIWKLEMRRAFAHFLCVVSAGALILHQGCPVMNTESMHGLHTPKVKDNANIKRRNSTAY